MHLERAPDGSLRLVTTRTRRDLTATMQAWIDRTLPDLAPLDLRGFVFKSRSPSSGMRGVKIYTGNGMPNGAGSGLFAAAFMARFPLLPVEEEGRLPIPPCARTSLNGFLSTTAGAPAKPMVRWARWWTFTPGTS